MIFDEKEREIYRFYDLEETNNPNELLEYPRGRHRETARKKITDL